jgi:hypothetical protein
MKALLQPRGRLAGIIKTLAICLGGLLLISAVPVLWIEARCMEPYRPAATSFKSLLPAADHRDEINSYLTYPEWAVVHAYADLAAATRNGSESDYNYFGAIRRFWSSLCSIRKMASTRGQISGDYRLSLHVIGLSFTGEMAIKGAYEKTLGRLTAVIRGSKRTPEDDFALRLADDYAEFLRQVPWYEYPFGTKLKQFWIETPVFAGNPVRKLERRIALTMEWGTKALYAQLIGFGAAAVRAPLRIRSVVAGLDSSDVAADPRIKLVQTVGTGMAMIETDRYSTFTDIMRGLAARGRDFTDIAGNQNILVTVFAPNGKTGLPEGATQLFEVPVVARPGWRRLALDVKVKSLTDVIRKFDQTGLVLEHVYDY